MKVLRKLILLLLCAIVPFCAFSQMPLVLKNNGNTLICLDSVQANKIAKKLLKYDLLVQKVDTLQLLNEFVVSEMGEIKKAYAVKKSELATTQTIAENLQKQINQYQAQLDAYKRSNRKAKVGRFFYKAFTLTLAATTVYFAVKK